jgi:hypothetical protein
MAIPKKPLPPVDDLRELLDYNPETGELSWKVDRGGKARRGAVAGTPKPHSIQLNFSRSWGKLSAHRVIWLIVTGEDPAELEVDHANGNPHDNRWENLRLATRSQNCANKAYEGKLPKGVCRVRRLKKRPFQARLQRRDGEKRIALSLGFFSSAEEAHQAYLAAAAQHYGEFACGGAR